MRPEVFARIVRTWHEIGGVPAGPDRITVATSPASRIAPPGWVGTVHLRLDPASARALVTAPDETTASAVRRQLSAVAPHEIGGPDAWGPLWPADPERVLGPSRLAYLDADDFVPVAGEVDTVDPDDARETVVALEAAAGPEDAGEVGLGYARRSPLFVVRRAGAAASICAYDPWRETFAHMMILTHPEHRGRGLAKLAASAGSTHALAAGLVPQWRTRRAASRAVAAALGYTALGGQLSLRIAAE